MDRNYLQSDRYLPNREGLLESDPPARSDSDRLRSMAFISGRGQGESISCLSSQCPVVTEIGKALCQTADCHPNVVLAKRNECPCPGSGRRRTLETARGANGSHHRDSQHEIRHNRLSRQHGLPLFCLVGKTRRGGRTADSNGWQPPSWRRRSLAFWVSIAAGRIPETLSDPGSAPCGADPGDRSATAESERPVCSTFQPEFSVGPICSPRQHHRGTSGL